MNGQVQNLDHKSTDKVGVIIVSYNQKAFFALLFKTLSEQSFKNFQIYLIDNCSNDGSVQHVKELCVEYNLQARYFELEQNTGYSGGNNYGFLKAVQDGCKYCLILNSDTELDKDCIKSLVDCIENQPEIVVTGPILFLGKGEAPNTTIQEFGANANFNSYQIKKNFASMIFEFTEKEIPEYLQVNYITGACILIKASLFVEIGLFDEKYFAYGEEIDLFKKINDKGFKSFVTKRAMVWHHHDWSRKNKRGYYIEYYLIQRNKYLYFRKFKLRKQMFKSIIKDFLMYPVYLLWFLRICDFKLSLYYLKGTIDGIMNKTGPPIILTY